MDSINYAFGLLNGNQIRPYILQEDSTGEAIDEFIDNINSLKSYQLRVSRKSDEVICERTMCLICNVSTHRNRRFHRSANHRTRHIYNRDAILFPAIVEVLEIIPILLKHKTSRIFKVGVVTHCEGSMSNVMWV